MNDEGKRVRGALCEKSWRAGGDAVSQVEHQKNCVVCICRDPSAAESGFSGSALKRKTAHVLLPAQPPLPLLSLPQLSRQLASRLRPAYFAVSQIVASVPWLGAFERQAVPFLLLDNSSGRQTPNTLPSCISKVLSSPIGIRPGKIEARINRNLPLDYFWRLTSSTVLASSWKWVGVRRAHLSLVLSLFVSSYCLTNNLMISCPSSSFLQRRVRSLPLLIFLHLPHNPTFPPVFHSNEEPG